MADTKDEGTDKSQNEGVITADVQTAHQTELTAMQTRFPEVAVNDLVRFLKARNHDLEKATEMMEAHLKWREETLPIPKEEVEATLATRKFYMLDELDQEGRPVVVYVLRRFKEAPYVVKDEIKALIYLTEHSVLPRYGSSVESQKVTVLIDISGITSPPLAFLTEMNEIMEANYPESLFRCIMFPVPYLLQTMIRGLIYFVDEDTRTKFAYVNDLKSLEESAMMSHEQMGPDIAELVETNLL